jgi:hypothetical protein
MTKLQTETQNVAFEVVKQLKYKGGYIKGYGDKMHRVCDGDHNPLMNIKNDVVECLKFNECIERTDLIYTPTGKINEIIFSDQLPIEGAVITKVKKKHYAHSK